jgi:polyisoprenyl-phosphate glycosyltransferase
MVERKKISIMTPVFNEELNVQRCRDAVRVLFATELKDYDYEHLFIDNCSTDKTVDLLREICATDKHVRVIVNSRNYGPHRSPYYGLLQMSGDAVVPIMCDLQTPVELIPQFVAKWSEGIPIVVGVRRQMKEGPILEFLRNSYYNILSAVSEAEQIRHFVGFGLFDRKVIDIIRDMDDSMPYFRGLIGEIGFDRYEFPYDQPPRKHGKSKQRWSDLFEYAVVGLTYSSRIPLRLVTMTGAVIGLASFACGMAYLVLKLLFWSTFELGLAPILIGVFFLGSIQIIFLGFVAEYVGMTFERVRKRPIVIEKERINF